MVGRATAGSGGEHASAGSTKMVLPRCVVRVAGYAKMACRACTVSVLLWLCRLRLCRGHDANVGYFAHCSMGLAVAVREFWHGVASRGGSGACCGLPMGGLPRCSWTRPSRSDLFVQGSRRMATAPAPEATCTPVRAMASRRRGETTTTELQVDPVHSDGKLACRLRLCRCRARVSGRSG